MTEAQLEIELAQKLEAYRAAFAEPVNVENLFDPRRQAAERSLCETLEMLTRPHVDVACDGLEIGSFAEPSAELIEIHGRMWCLGDPGGSWQEPFFARIKVGPASRAIVGYSIGMGSSAHGLDKFPFNARRPPPEPSTREQCLFYFEK